MPLRCSAVPKAVGLAIAALFAAEACGQPVGEPALDRVFHLTYTETMQEFQEVVTTLRTIVDLRPISADGAQRSLALRGPADQIALSQWLINELDRPVNAQQTQHLEMREYRLPGSSGDVVRVVYLSYAQTPQDLQEIATVLRTTADIRRLHICGARKALTLRGKLDEVDLAQWLVEELGKAAAAQPFAPPGQNPAVREYSSAGSGDEVVQISYLMHTETLQRVSEISTLLRLVAGVRRLFTYSSRKAMVMRGSQDQMALARWLVSELDQPGSGPPRAQQGQEPDTREYLPPGSGDVVRVVYLTYTQTAQERQEIATLIRAKANIRQLFIYNARKALALRGTADRISLAESLIKERDKPNAQ